MKEGLGRWLCNGGVVTPMGSWLRMSPYVPRVDYRLFFKFPINLDPIYT